MCDDRLTQFKNASAESLLFMHPDSAIKSNLLDNLTDYFGDIVNTLSKMSFRLQCRTMGFTEASRTVWDQ